MQGKQLHKSLIYMYNLQETTVVQVGFTTVVHKLEGPLINFEFEGMFFFLFVSNS